MPTVTVLAVLAISGLVAFFLAARTFLGVA
jgi:hypothetical protein